MILSILRSLKVRVEVSEISVKFLMVEKIVRPTPVRTPTPVSAQTPSSSTVLGDDSSKWSIAFSELEILETVGSGSFGKVPYSLYIERDLYI